MISEKGVNGVLEKILWNLFINTGDLNIYLDYKDIEKTMEKRKNKKDRKITKEVFLG